MSTDYRKLCTATLDRRLTKNECLHSAASGLVICSGNCLDHVRKSLYLTNSKFIIDKKLLILDLASLRYYMEVVAISIDTEWPEDFKDYREVNLNRERCKKLAVCFGVTSYGGSNILREIDLNYERMSACPVKIKTFLDSVYNSYKLAAFLLGIEPAFVERIGIEKVSAENNLNT